MTVYLGDSGGIELQRTSGSVNITLLDGDVNVDKRRLSPEEDIQGTLVTGDRVDIATRDGSNLVLIDGHNFNDWRGYVYVDEIGGIRLYDKYADAIEGALNKALPLVASTEQQDLLMQTRGDAYTPLGQITSYEFTTERETVNTTHLGSQFVQQYEAGLISGQGTMNAFGAICQPL